MIFMRCLVSMSAFCEPSGKRKTCRILPIQAISKRSSAFGFSTSAFFCNARIIGRFGVIEAASTARILCGRAIKIGTTVFGINTASRNINSGNVEVLIFVDLLSATLFFEFCLSCLFCFSIANNNYFYLLFIIYYLLFIIYKFSTRILKKFLEIFSKISWKIFAFYFCIFYFCIFLFFLFF